MFAARTAWNLSPNRLTLLLEGRRASGRRVLDLTESNPTRCGFRYGDASILAAIARRESLVYEPHPRGLPQAREALAAEYRSRGIEVSPERVVLTSGTSEAYCFLFRLLTNPGDEILAPIPSYPLFELLGQLNDVRLVSYPLSPGMRFAVDIEAIAKALSPRTRAVLLVSPGVPAGAFLKRSELAALVEICAPRGIPLICDEVFGDYGFEADAQRVVSVAGHERAMTFVLNGLSKMLALPQLKLAWIAASGPAAQVEESLRRLEVIADTYLSVNTPVQWALPALLAGRAGIQEQIRARLARNLDFLMRQTGSFPPCPCLPAEGGWSAILQVPRTRGEEEWALRLLEKDGVLAYPGYFFDFPGEGHLVVSLLAPPERFEEGIHRLLARVAAEA